MKSARTILQTETSIHFSHNKDEWATPDDFFQVLDAIYHFDLDAAADETNHQCPLWLGPGGLRNNALFGGWAVGEETTVWLNPPFSKNKEFVAKALFEADIQGVRSVILIPARTDTKYFHEVIWPHAQTIIFLKGRLKFGGAKNAAPFPSMIVIFEPSLDIATQHVYTWDWRKETYPVG